MTDSVEPMTLEEAQRFVESWERWVQQGAKVVFSSHDATQFARLAATLREMQQENERLRKECDRWQKEFHDD